MALENLAVRISSQTADVRSGLAAVKRGFSSLGREAVSTRADFEVAEGGLEDVRSGALSTAGALSLLQGRADEAGDETLVAGSKAAAAGGMFSTASVGTHGFSFSLGTLSSVITLTAIPALVALSTTLVPLTATLTGFVAAAGGLAGAFAGVLGAGALQYGSELSDQYSENLEKTEARIDQLEDMKETLGGLNDTRQEELENLKDRRDELEKATSPMGALQRRMGELKTEIAGVVSEWAAGQGFGNLVRDAVNAIPRLVKNTLDAVGSLVDFKAVLRDLGRVGMQAIPSLVSTLVRVGREALPLFIDGVRWLQANGASIFERIMSTTRRVGPMLLDVGKALASILPSVNRFGTNVLSGLLPVLEDGIKGFGDLLTRINEFTQTDQFDKIVTALSNGVRELSPELNELGSNLGTLFETLVENGPQIINGFVAVADAVLDIANAVIPVLNVLIDLVGMVAQGFADISEWYERQNQRRQRQGTASYYGGAIASMASRDIGAQQRANLGSTLNQINVKVEADDERFNAYADERAQRQIERREALRRRRGERRRPSGTGVR